MTEKQIYKNGTILRKISPSFLWVKRISYFLLAVLSLVSISCERKNLPDAQPFDDHLSKFEANGAQILSMLERCTANLPSEEGQLPQVSGLRYTVHLRSDTVSDVVVLEEASGEWVPLDPAGYYTIASSDYYARGGFYETLKDCKQLIYSTGLVRDALSDYMETNLGGVISGNYARPQGRITIVDD